MKAFTNAIQEQIIEYKKSRLDISDLIKNVDISGQDLSNTIISRLDISDQDIKETNFANAILGTKDTIINVNRSTLDGSCLAGITCTGNVWARRTSFKNCNFKRAFVPYIDFRYADFRGASFCETIFTIGTEKAVGAIFDKDFFRDLAGKWGIVVLYESEYQELIKKGELNEHK